MSDLKQIEWESVEAAYAEGAIEPEKMVRFLLLDAEELSSALNDLVEAGLLELEGARFKLTAEGKARVEARHARESAGVKRATRTWQSK